MTGWEWEVSVTADIEYTPRVHADSVDEAEETARKQIKEGYGVTVDTVQHETELPDGRHQVCVWAERHLYESVVEAIESDALEAGREQIEREYAVQTSDVHGANARKLREVDIDDGGESE
ncbi:hypothetical protein [Natronorubrum halophilum]|uniref:hypothetical protein n=1 Tax=Natronorubrum halophilum TaxID=1702106 RepID=UPI000EF715C0|nr:hypothetical protein [Natronorubrum halophilum]